MTGVALTGYALAMTAYLALLAIMIFNWRGGPTATWFAAAIAVSALWCGGIVAQLYSAPGVVLHAGMLLGGEMVRDIAWLIVLARLVKQTFAAARSTRWITVAVVAAGVTVLVTLSALTVPNAWFATDAGALAEGVRTVLLSVLVLLSVIVLVLIEQFFRSVAPARRWTIKYLCFGLGGMFAFDFYMYSEALLFQAVDLNVWSARGFVNVLMIPLIGLSLSRNPDWAIDVFVSRKVAFHTVTLLGTGAYLIAMSMAGYYIRVVGGDWGLIGQTVFLFSAIVLLFAVMFSGEARARIKVFFNKHFTRSKYDYREEWLRITDALSGARLEPALRERALFALAQVVESTGGALFLRSGATFRVVAETNLAVPQTLELEWSDPIVAFLNERRWVINLNEFMEQPHHYGDLNLPEWLRRDPRAWLVVPLLQHDELFGFAVLARGRAPMATNWEIRDMLLMTGRQVASHLALLDANEALIEARQFEAFNRLSAYVVHDLKNLIAQLSLVVSNAARHRTNQAFMDDAISTVGNAVDKMNKLLGQLRKGRVESSDARRADLLALVKTAVNHRSSQQPIPILSAKESEYVVVANPDRLTAVVEHLIQNAQEATPVEGRVDVQVWLDGDAAILKVSDTGSGMDPAFVREQLFKPFRTTKGNAGMGIGVYESREFVRAIGGRMDVQSKLGQGTEFTLWIPLHRSNSDVSHHRLNPEAKTDGKNESQNVVGC